MSERSPYVRFRRSLETRKLEDALYDAKNAGKNRYAVFATTMHEAAHQLSFNCGVLNRQGDLAIWLNAAESDVHVNCEIVKTVTVTGTGGDD